MTELHNAGVAAAVQAFKDASPSDTDSAAIYRVLEAYVNTVVSEYDKTTTYLEPGTNPAPVSPFDVPGYEALARVLKLAYDQSARGKGKDRHANNNKPFDQQPILAIGRMCGIGYHTGQNQKKVQEATTMHLRGNYEGAKAELLGAIVFAAAAYLLVEEQQPKDTGLI